MVESSNQRTREKAQANRRALANRIADIFLSEGVADMPLRELAARLGTSDRMLIYYFGEKAVLVEAAIGCVAAQLDVLLASRERTEGRLAPVDVMKETAALMAVPGMSAFRAVWADILARGGRGETPFASIAQALVSASLARLEARLAVEDACRRADIAASILAAIEGVWLIGMVAPGSTDRSLDILAECFAGL